MLRITMIASALLLLFACERPSPCLTKPAFEGEALRFISLTDEQQQTFDEALGSNSTEVLENGLTFNAWAHEHAKDLVGTINFAEEVVMLSGMSDPNCTECMLFNATFDAEESALKIELEMVERKDCEGGSFSGPLGLLVLNRPSFRVEDVQLRTRQDSY